MAKAVWKGATLAESERTVLVEGNHYFPPESINRDYFVDSESRTVCPWKGDCFFYTIEVNGDENYDAAWFYPKPSRAAQLIKDYIAF